MSLVPYSTSETPYATLPSRKIVCGGESHMRALTADMVRNKYHPNGRL
jgi:hypothetical protein